MRLIKRLSMGVGATALAALLLAVLAPKAAHAIAAAMVLVTNTTANPAITQAVPTLASQIVVVDCSAVSGDSNCKAVMPGGILSSTTYSVPAGQNLVITHVEVTPRSTGGGTAAFSLQNIPCTAGPCSLAPPGWSVLENGQTHDFSISPGIVWPSGAPLVPDQPSLCNCFAVIYGYLTAN